MVRTFLMGSFANTAFCVLAPDGEARLSRSGRGPSALFGRRGGPEVTSEKVVQALKRISAKYSLKGTSKGATLPDFHSTRQAVNVASGDQRLLLLTVASEEERGQVKKTLRPVLNDPEVIGRFHHDFAEAEGDQDWTELLEGKKSKTGFFLVQAGSFGLAGTVVAELPLTSDVSELKTTLLKSNQAFAKTEERKVYREHVKQGRRQRIHFENEVPYGEDRDGDGVIDKKSGRKRR